MITCNKYLCIDGYAVWNTKTQDTLKSKIYNTTVIIVTNAVLTESNTDHVKKSSVNKINYLVL